MTDDHPYQPQAKVCQRNMSSAGCRSQNPTLNMVESLSVALYRVITACSQRDTQCQLRINPTDRTNQVCSFGYVLFEVSLLGWFQPGT